LQQQRLEGWGSKVIDRRYLDLMREFPEMKGISPRNLKYMRRFAQAYPDESIVQDVLAQITWYHNITILYKLKDAAAKDFYVQAHWRQNQRGLCGELFDGVWNVSNWRTEINGAIKDFVSVA
jgi:predicted nuclease of restriction endonuclease-like (RecB) superfamily